VSRRIARWGVCCALTAFSGCGPAWFAQQADRIALKTMAAGEKASLGEAKPFDVEYNPLFEEKTPANLTEICLGEKRIPLSSGSPSVQLSVNDCLEIAFRNSRELQNRREDLYVAALELANARRGWDFPLLDGMITADADFERTLRDGETKGAAAGLNPSLTQRFITGGVLTLAATLDWATDFLLGSESNIATSMLEANFSQPLLRGAWRGIAYEEQYRLERDFLFAVFSFDRYRQTFAADIYTQYHNLLQQRDRLENEKANIERLESTVRTTAVLVEGGNISRVELNEAEQNLLDAQIQREQNIQNFNNALDAYKIQLGLPIGCPVKLEYPAALEQLHRQGLQKIPLQEDQAMRVALSVRPDVLTERANVRDAARDIMIAADQFNPQLDVELGLSVPGTDPQKFYRLQFHRRTQYAGVTFNWQLDQTDNRDDYRVSLIAYDRSMRNLEEFIDTVRLQVRQSYRELLQSKHTYELRTRNVKMAQQRRELASLQQKAGLLAARDVLDSENALLRAQNGLTNAMVSYATTRIQFLATLGLIDVDKKGHIHERDKPFRFDKIEKRYPYVGGE
jgi:outer membrane protein TolC